MGPSDRSCHEGQAKIATERVRDSNDEIIVREKLDGSNVGVAKIDKFADWVMKPENWERFNACLNEGERLAGEWLLQAHSTRYALEHKPFVTFDLMIDHERKPYDELMNRVTPFEFITPHLIHRGGPISVENVMSKLNKFGFHGALDEVEGAVWHVERDKPTTRKGEMVRVVDFLVKYVRPDKKDGIYFPEVSGEEIVWNLKTDS